MISVMCGCLVSSLVDSIRTIVNSQQEHTFGIGMDATSAMDDHGAISSSEREKAFVAALMERRQRFEAAAMEDRRSFDLDFVRRRRQAQQKAVVTVWFHMYCCVDVALTESWFC